MSDVRPATDAVLALVRVINGDAPRLAAHSILQPEVQIHMDSAEHRGIDLWYKWIHLIRNCGRVSDLRMTDCKTQCDPSNPNRVHLTARWTGIVGARHVPGISPYRVELDYLADEGRIKEIWTHKTNYEFIFGRWIKYSICYRLFLGWAIVYFKLLAARRKSFLADLVVKT